MEQTKQRTLKNKRKMNKCRDMLVSKPVYVNNASFFNENVTVKIHKKPKAKDVGKGGSIEISCLCIDQSRY